MILPPASQVGQWVLESFSKIFVSAWSLNPGHKSDDLIFSKTLLLYSPDWEIPNLCHRVVTSFVSPIFAPWSSVAVTGPVQNGHLHRFQTHKPKRTEGGMLLVPGEATTYVWNFRFENYPQILPVCPMDKMIDSFYTTNPTIRRLVFVQASYWTSWSCWWSALYLLSTMLKWMSA